MKLFPPKTRVRKLLKARRHIIRSLANTDNSNSRGRSNPREKKGWNKKYARKDENWKPGQNRDIRII